VPKRSHCSDVHRLLHPPPQALSPKGSIGSSPPTEIETNVRAGFQKVGYGHFQQDDCMVVRETTLTLNPIWVHTAISRRCRASGGEGRGGEHTPSIIMASRVVSASSSGEPPNPTVKSHCDCSQDRQPCGITAVLDGTQQYYL
jgi:hypothetical protein